LGILRGMARFRGDFVDAEICDACGKPITKQQWITEGIASTLSDRGPVQFHVGCFQFWDTERRAPKTSSGLFALLTIALSKSSTYSVSSAQRGASGLGAV